MADAAERTVWLNVAQVGIGTITFGLLVLTALYGYRSANAAREAATASLKAADVADRAMKISNRPYVLVKEVRLSLWSLRPKAFVTLQNYGQTPAFAVSSNLDLLHTNDPEQTSKMPEEIFQSSPLAPNDPWDFTVASQIQTIPEQWEHVKEGKLFWRLAGTIVYRDIFGEQHITLVNYVYGQRYSLRETGHMVPGRVGNDAG